MKFRKWRRPDDHPAQETWLLFLEGELPARDGAAAAEHLKQCWSCRLHAEQLGRGIRRFMEYRQDVLRSHAAAPPNADDFSVRLHRASVDTDLPPALFQRIPRPVYVSCGLVLAVMTVVVAESIITSEPKHMAAPRALSTQSPRVTPPEVRHAATTSTAVLRRENLPEPVEMEAPAPPSAQELSEAEWQVRLAMHRMGADEGEDLHVKSDAWNVMVGGVLESDDRKRQVEDQLRSISHVVSHLVTVEQAVAEMQSSAAPNQITVSTPTPAFEKELAAHFPANGDREAFVNNALRLSGRASSAAFALRALLDRYDDGSVALLSGASQQELEQVIRDHVASMGAASAGFAAAIRPLVELGATVTDASPENWRRNLGETASLVIEIHELALEALSGSTAGRSADTVRYALSSEIHAFKVRLLRARRHLQQPFLIQN